MDQHISKIILMQQIQNRRNGMKMRYEMIIKIPLIKWGPNFLPMQLIQTFNMSFNPLFNQF